MKCSLSPEAKEERGQKPPLIAPRQMKTNTKEWLIKNPQPDIVRLLDIKNNLGISAVVAKIEKSERKKQFINSKNLLRATFLLFLILFGLVAILCKEHPANVSTKIPLIIWMLVGIVGLLGSGLCAKVLFALIEIDIPDKNTIMLELSDFARQINEVAKLSALGDAIWIAKENDLKVIAKQVLKKRASVVKGHEGEIDQTKEWAIAKAGLADSYAVFEKCGIVSGGYGQYFKQD
jgi:hypothetical protein